MQIPVPWGHIAGKCSTSLNNFVLAEIPNVAAKFLQDSQIVYPADNQ